MNKLQVKYDSATMVNPGLIESMSDVRGLGADGDWTWLDDLRTAVNKGIDIYNDARNQLKNPPAAAPVERTSATPTPAPSWFPGVSNSVVVLAGVGLVGGLLLIRKR